MKWIGSYLANLPCSNFSYQRNAVRLFLLVFRRLQICLKMPLSVNGFLPIFHCVSFHQSNYLFNSRLLLFIACDTSSKPPIPFQNGSVLKAAADCPFPQLLWLNLGVGCPALCFNTAGRRPWKSRFAPASALAMEPVPWRRAGPCFPDTRAVWTLSQSWGKRAFLEGRVSDGRGNLIEEELVVGSTSEWVRSQH